MEYLNGRMTAGIPSLLPGRRRKMDTVVRTRHVDSQNLRQQYERDFATTAPDGERPVTSLEAQLGKPLTSQQVIALLSRLNPSLHFEVSLADSTKMGIYRLSPEGKQFVCGMERGFMPEFSVRHAEEIEMPDPDLKGGKVKVRRITRETRGWRTVLARLIHSGIVRQVDAEQCFPMGRDSRNWKALTT